MTTVVQKACIVLRSLERGNRLRLDGIEICLSEDMKTCTPMSREDGTEIGMVFDISVSDLLTECGKMSEDDILIIAAENALNDKSSCDFS